ncbi:OmpA family protein [Erythrobacter sp. LQ02-29]|uniref:OmpA family protein n=1 Tax=Erythrobacter sp. LQ02-29 TaxID=2920384 RepID=UPI001F4DBA23|nr:OmpA family protein [Erythrobacter sp. LQ02-29]MCP9221748.1 OmpA family protein [Erythrobacter sp. LQ02-29]
MNRTPLITIAAAALVLGAAGCDDGRDADPSPAPTQTSTPTSADPVSIIRPDIEEAPMVPLAPLNATIGFGSTGAEISPEAETQLQDVLDSPQLARGQAITIRGHSDSSGRNEANMKLSQERADAVRDWLVDHGVAKERLTVIAFGEQNPVQPNALPDGTPNEPGRAANRRVEIHVAVPEGATMTAEEAQSAQEKDAARAAAAPDATQPGAEPTPSQE